jgi:hypothetical protein
MQRLRRLVRFGGLMLAIVTLAAFNRFWSRMTGASEEAVLKVDNARKLALAAPGNRTPNLKRPRPPKLRRSALNSSPARPRLHVGTTVDQIPRIVSCHRILSEPAGHDEPLGSSVCESPS